MRQRQILILPTEHTIRALKANGFVVVHKPTELKKLQLAKEFCAVHNPVGINELRKTFEAKP